MKLDNLIFRVGDIVDYEEYEIVIAEEEGEDELKRLLRKRKKKFKELKRLLRKYFNYTNDTVEIVILFDTKRGIYYIEIAKDLNDDSTIIYNTIVSIDDMNIFSMLRHCYLLYYEEDYDLIAMIISINFNEKTFKKEIYLTKDGKIFRYE